MKKNILTPKEARVICDRLKKSTKPSKALKKYVHEELLKDAHIMYQYKVEKERFGYCTHCKNDFPLELKNKRTITDNDIDLIEAKHNEKVVCPCCGLELTKKYAGISRSAHHAQVAEFKVDKTGALIVYVYRFTYNYKANFRVNEPEWTCWQIAYFDIHKYFHLLYGWFNENVYLGDRYTDKISFTNSNRTIEPTKAYHFEIEGIKCFGLKKALQKSNLKYSCLMEYMEDSVVDMFKYLKFYCSYPEITEKLMKEGFKKIILSYLYGVMSGCFNFRGKTVSKFLKLDKQHLKLLKDNSDSRFYKDDIKAMQFIQKNNIKPTKENYGFLKDYYGNIHLIELLYQFVGIQKLQTYVKKQGALCRCRYSYGTDEQQFFDNYKDYISQCKQLGYDLNDKNVVMPANLFQAHNELTELMNRRKAEEKAKANEAKLKKFEKRLPKLKEKYTFSDGTFLIRPAESYEDLCAEGTALHHCVYSIYADKYINGETDILFIRKVSEPDKPFYTLEYYRNQVIQCRTIHNGAATDEIKAFVEKWKQFLKENKNQHKKKEAA